MNSFNWPGLAFPSRELINESGASHSKLWIHALISGAWIVLMAAALSANGAAPIITNFAPAAGGPGIRVTINGANFTGGQQVSFNGVVADFVFLSANQISATVPLDATTGPISVDTPAGQAISVGIFYVAPVITDFSPDNGPPGTIVVIDGFNFDNATAVQFNGKDANAFAVTVSSQLQAVVPSGATTGSISVTTPAGTGFSTNQFLVTTTAPAITGFDPSFGPPGTSVAIHGNRFLVATAVNFNGTNAKFAIVAMTQIQATVPAQATTGPITVTTALGTGASSSNYVVTGKAPIISGFNPKNAKPGTTVVIDGINFTTASAVAFNGTNAMFGVVADTQIQAVVPANATNGFISVTNPAGTGVSTNLFLVTGFAPIITNFSPTFGLPGSPVVIEGENFLTATNVTFNGTNAVFALTAPGQITAFVPKGAADGLLQVLSADGVGASTNSFNVITAAPAVTDFSPAGGPPGTVIVVNGANFAGVTNVAFSGVRATDFAATADTQLQVTVPGGANTGPIQVSNPFGTGASKTNFIVAPRIANFTPGSGPVGTSVALNGANLLTTRLVLFNGVAAAFTAPSETLLRATVPLGATDGPITLANSAGATSTTNDFVVTRAADVGLGVVVSPAVAELGGPLDYFFTITNRGPDTASRVTLTGPLPSNVPLLSATASQGACVNQGGQLICGLGPVAAGASVSVRLQFLPASEGGAASSFSVLAVEPDLVASNNTVQATAIVVPGGLPQLRVQNVDQQIVLSWGTTNGGFVLESSDRLTLPIPWTAITNVASTPGLQRFTIGGTNVAQFFRLHKP